MRFIYRFLSRFGAHLGNLNDRVNGSSTGYPHGRNAAWRPVDRVASWLYVLGDRVR